MAKVKIKIEVNPNADDEELGNIQNQVNNTPSLENVSNVSVKIRGDGIYEEIPSNSGGINGLSLGYALVFDENGYLDNADLEGGVLESTENPIEFVWGVVPESGEYTVRLTFTDAQSLKDITIFGDSEVNQFPTRAIIDGYKEITNDDLTWYINFGNEASTHTIEFTHWNKVNYNACLSKIGITLQYIEIDKTSGLKSVDSTSQSSTDTTGIFYGTVENRGSLEILDKTGELVDMLKDGIIDNSNTKLEIVANNETIQTHISTDSTYNTNSQVMSLDLGNRLSSLDILKYNGYDYPDHSERLSVLFFDVLSNLRYALFGTDKALTQEEFREMLSGKYDSSRTLYDYLYSIEVEYPVIEANKTYREVIDEFCLVAQMQMYIDDEDNVRFVSARPKNFDEDAVKIHIPKKNMFSQLDYSVILKNKYDGIEISRTVVNDELKYNEKLVTTEPIDSRIIQNQMINSYYPSSDVVYNIDTDVSGINILNLEYKTVAVSLSGIKGYYLDGSFKIPINSDNGLEENIEVYNKTFTGEGSPTFSLKCLKVVGSCSCQVQPSTKSIKSAFNLSLPQASAGDEYFGYPPQETSNIYEATGIFQSTANSSIKQLDQSYISATKDENSDVYNITYHILVGQDVFNLGNAYKINTDLDEDSTIITIGGKCERYYPVSAEISVFGVKRVISFTKLDANTENIENAKTKVSLGSSNLLQSDAVIDTIKNNILYDYKNGISNATVSVSCNDYYDVNGEKVIDWSKGEVLKVNQIVYFDNDLYADKSQRYWKIKGRTFRKTGVPMIDLDLEETKIKPLSDYSWSEINEISKSGYASSEFSIGEKKNITLSDGKEITAVIIGFNHDTIASDNSKAGITFAIADLNEKSAKGTNSDSATSWEDSIIRKDFLPNIYTNMPLDLQNSIKRASKVSLNGDSGQTTNDKLWLFSISELTGGDSNFGNKYDEGKQYKYFARTLQDLIYPKSVDWWLRSCFIHNNYKYNAYMQTSLNGFTVNGSSGSNAKNYVMFGFCI